MIRNAFIASEIENVKTQKQRGSKDCGLFAIAYATALLNEIDVSNIKFDQSKMRQHLLSCFVNKSVTPFLCCNCKSMLQFPML